LIECRLDPRKAKTIRGDDWIACLGSREQLCGRLFEVLRAQGAGAHLAEHGFKADDEYRDTWEYSRSTALISNARAATLRETAADAGNLKPDAGLANLRPQKKGWKVSLEFRHKQSERRGTRHFEKDARLARLWLLDGKGIEQVADDLAITAGAVHGHLGRIFGARVKDRVVFSRGELVTDTWVNRLCDRFGHLSKLQLGRLVGVSGDFLQDVGAVKKNRALTLRKAESLVSGETELLKVLANADGDRADYLRVVVPDLVQKWDGAIRAIKLVRDEANGQELDAGLNEL
jgi:hypothetical protein